MPQLWKPSRMRHQKAYAPPINLDRGHPFSPARRAIEALLPGQKYVLATGHNPAFVYTLNVAGRKRYAVTKLPCGRLMVTRTA